MGVQPSDPPTLERTLEAPPLQSCRGGTRARPFPTLIWRRAGRKRSPPGPMGTQAPRAWGGGGRGALSRASSSAHFSRAAISGQSAQWRKALVNGRQNGPLLAKLTGRAASRQGGWGRGRLFSHHSSFSQWPGSWAEHSPPCR